MAFDISEVAESTLDDAVIPYHVGNANSGSTKGNARGDAKGRKAFADGICEYHPTWTFPTGDVVTASEEFPCARFGHLPGRGVGVYQPSGFRTLAVIMRSLIKPIGILVVLGLACWGLSVVVGIGARKVSHLNDRNHAGTHANTNRDGNGDSTANVGTGNVGTNGGSTGRDQSGSGNLGIPSGSNGRSANGKAKVTR